MDAVGWIVTTVVIVGLGRVLVVPYRRRLMAALVGSSPARLRAMYGGLVVVGRVRREGPALTAPLSGRSCVAYQIVVEARRRRERWLVADQSGPLFQQQEASPFVVATERSEALIDLSGPFNLSLAADQSGVTDWLTPHPGRYRRLAEVLLAAGIRTRNFLGTWRSLTYVERILTEHEVVGVEGPGASEVDPAGERPDLRSPPQRLVLRGTDEYPLQISDG